MSAFEEIDIENMSDLEASQWSCRSFILSLLSKTLSTPDVPDTLDYGRRQLGAGTEVIIGIIRRMNDPIAEEAFSALEFVVEGALRIGLASAEEQACQIHKNDELSLKGKPGQVARAIRLQTQS